HDGPDAGRHNLLGQPRGRLRVDLPVLVEDRDERDADPAEQSHTPTITARSTEPCLTGDVDERLIAAVMRKYNLRTKREAIDFAVRRLADPALTPTFLASLRGIGWDGDLDEMRSGRSGEQT